MFNAQPTGTVISRRFFFVGGGGGEGVRLKQIRAKTKKDYLEINCSELTPRVDLRV